MRYAHVGPDPIDVAGLVQKVQHPRNGGIVTFIGSVRDSAAGRPVIALEYSAYVEMAQKELAAIVAEAAASAAASEADIAVAHRIGQLAIGDVSVAVAAGHPHRGPAFDACRYVIEEIKRRVPIWKREHYVGGAAEWVMPLGVPAQSVIQPVESSEGGGC